MTDQLVLIDSHPAWRIDSGTRERGLRGVAAAREALQEARGRAAADPPSESEADTDPDDNDALASAA